MVNGVPGCLSTGPQASQTHWETARELLCRNRRLFGILKRVHCRRNWEVREGSKGGKPPRRTRQVLQSLWPSLDGSRPRGGSTVAMALCRPHRGGLRDQPHGDPSCQRRVARYNREDRSARCTRHRSALTHGVVPAGPRQICGIAGGACPPGCAQATAAQAQDIELSLRGILRGFGLKVGKVTDKTFEARIRELVTGHPMLEQIAEAMLAARAALLEQFKKLHKAVLKIVRHDEICRRFMTTPSVGAIVAITYKSALDDPGRIKKSRNAGPLFGLTPKRYQSGETDITGGISRVGDEMVRTALYEAANVLLSRVTRFSALKRWGLEVAKRRGMKRAKVAVARKLAVILHRIWIDGSTFRWTKSEAAYA